MAEIGFEGFPGGINNRSATYAVPDGFCRNAVNVWFRSDGHVVRRDGWTRKIPGDAHSLFDHRGMLYFVQSGTIKMLDEAGVINNVKSGLSDTRMNYAPVGADLFCSNGVETGHLRHGVWRNWGVEKPPHAPRVTAVPTGGLFPGTYQVVISWIDDRGIEGGATNPVAVVVTDGGGILVDRMPFPPDYVARVAVYVTAANGIDFLADMTLPRSATEHWIGRSQRSVGCSVMFQNKPAASTEMITHHGQIYMARGNRVHYTRAGNLFLEVPLDFWQFESDVRLLASVSDGVYVGTEHEHFFIVPGDPFPLRRTIAEFGAVAGTRSITINGDSSIWMTHQGLVEGGISGQMRLMTHEHFAFPKAQSGSSMIIHVNGEEYALVALQGLSANPLQNTDAADRELARKGNVF